jgi:hypothetical protein
MANPKFEMGDRVENTKTKQVGFVKRQRGEGVYMVSVQGFGEQQWNEADMEKSQEPKNKWNRTWTKRDRTSRP